MDASRGWEREVGWDRVLTWKFRVFLKELTWTDNPAWRGRPDGLATA